MNTVADDPAIPKPQFVDSLRARLTWRAATAGCRLHTSWRRGSFAGFPGQSSEAIAAARQRDRRTGVPPRTTWAMAMAISVLPVPISAITATELACWSLFAAPADRDRLGSKRLPQKLSQNWRNRVAGGVQSGETR